MKNRNLPAPFNQNDNYPVTPFNPFPMGGGGFLTRMFTRSIVKKCRKSMAEQTGMIKFYKEYCIAIREMKMAEYQSWNVDAEIQQMGEDKQRQTEIANLDHQIQLETKATELINARKARENAMNERPQSEDDKSARKVEEAMKMANVNREFRRLQLEEILDTATQIAQVKSGVKAKFDEEQAQNIEDILDQLLARKEIV